MMGSGNLTELSHADTTGLTLLLMGITSELKINHILTTQVSDHCKTVIKAKAGDCCVFCSYGDINCPPIQKNSAV